MKTLLLHTCCAPCAAHAIERMRAEGYVVTLYFSNSNIAPAEEYEQRLLSVRFLAEQTGAVLIEDAYAHDLWLAHVQGLEGEPEKGRRCHKCFEYNLERTARYADEKGFEYFTTTLTISPHKIARDIFHIGSTYPKYLPVDFKKQDGFKHSMAHAKEWKLYRQQYCGCEFSILPPRVSRG
ncbi:MAG: epoxyqueuosine reductase QueH [Spartobacteria bacterium]|nr:epoxyqueuosine reductase QueH [Spartobacteria bacterium]